MGAPEAPCSSQRGTRCFQAAPLIVGEASRLNNKTGELGPPAILKWMTTNPANKLKSRPIVFEKGDPVAEMKEYTNPFVGYENATVDRLPVCVIGVPGTG